MTWMAPTPAGDASATMVSWFIRLSPDFKIFDSNRRSQIGNDSWQFKNAELKKQTLPLPAGFKLF